MPWLMAYVLWYCFTDLMNRGPLIFCLLLSMFLSMAKGDQSDLVFSGVFSLVWIGEAVVTLQIKLLGGNMYVLPLCPVVEMVFEANLSPQLVLPVCLYHRLHAIPPGYRRTSQRNRSSNDCADTGLPRLNRLVYGCRREYPRRLWSRAKPCGNCGISAFCLLHRDRVPLLHQLNDVRPAAQHLSLVDSLEECQNGDFVCDLVISSQCDSSSILPCHICIFVKY